MADASMVSAAAPEEEEEESSTPLADPAAEAARLKRAAKKKAQRERAKANKTAALASGEGAWWRHSGATARMFKRRLRADAPVARQAHRRRLPPRAQVCAEPGRAAGRELTPARSSAALPVQTEPPSVPIAAFFPSGRYPEGEIQQYRDECVPGP